MTYVSSYIGLLKGYIEQYIEQLQVKQLVDLGVDVKAVDKRKVGALHYACGQGRLEVVHFLWSRGLELDAEDPGLSVSVKLSEYFAFVRYIYS